MIKYALIRPTATCSRKREKGKLHSNQSHLQNITAATPLPTAFFFRDIKFRGGREGIK